MLEQFATSRIYTYIYYMKAGIYKITSPSEKTYIGQAVNLEERLKDYKNYNCKVQRLIYNSLKKYGHENHIFEILIEGEFSLIELNILEDKYIKEHNSFRGWNKKGLNLTTGGDVYKRDNSSKLLISESLKKYHKEIGHSEETRKKIAESLTGKKQSQEAINKRADSNRKFWTEKDLQTEFSKVGRQRKKENSKELRNQVDIRNQEIIQLLKDGIEQKLIAKRYNLSPSVITQLKKKNGLIIDNRAISKGTNNNFAKLNEDQVVNIKKMLKEKAKQQEIADKYHVSKRTIEAIASRQNWSHITID